MMIKEFRGKSFIVACAVTVLLLGLGCGQKKEDESKKKVVFESQKAKVTDVERKAQQAVIQKKEEEWVKAPIRIGVAGQFTSVSIFAPTAFAASNYNYITNDQGIMIKAAIEMFLDKLNEAGGINGQKVGIVYSDDFNGVESLGGGADKVKEAAQKLATDESLSLVVGHFLSSSAKIARPTYEEKKIVQLVGAMVPIGADDPRLAAGSQWTFFAGHKEANEGVTMAHYAKTKLGLSTAAVIYGDDASSTIIKEAFVSEAKKIGLQVVAEEIYDITMTEYTEMLTKIKELKVEVILIVGTYFEGAAIAAEARKMGIEAKLLGTDGMISPSLIESGGTAVEGMIFPNTLIGEERIKLGSPEIQNFVKEFEKKNAEQPIQFRFPNPPALLAYDAFGMAIEAIKKAGKDREAIRKELASWTTSEKGYRGLTGITYFGEDKEVRKILPVITIQGGKFVAGDGLS